MFDLPEDKYIVLESAFYPGQYVGIQEDGNLLPPGETPFRDRASLFISFPHSPITDVSNSIGKKHTKWMKEGSGKSIVK